MLLDFCGNLYLSYTFLRTYVSQKTIEDWKQRKVGKRRYSDGQAFIEYHSIPKKTRSKLPPEPSLKATLKSQNYNQEADHYFHLLEKAFINDFSKYIPHYKQDKRLTTSQITHCAKLRAVWEKIFQFNNGYERGLNEHLFNAFNRLFDKKYSTLGAFNVVKSKAKKEIDTVVIDTRWFREQHSDVDPRIQLLTKTLCSDGVNHTATYIHAKVIQYCIQEKLKAPSYSWVKKQVRIYELNPEIYASRFGKDKAFAKVQPYAKIISALNAGTQWQIDGWHLPFYYQGIYKGKLTSYLRLVLVAVRDAHSKKIVGYSIAESEDTQSIINAIQDAVKNTGFLPHEIVSDNHSFNKTSEAKYFKAAIDSLGVTWNVDHNPQRKSIAERYFRHLGEKHCKEYSGYIGQGIKSKEKSARPSQEYQDAHTKSSSWLTKEEIQLIGVAVVSKFNQVPLKSLGYRSPDHVHRDSEKPYVIPVDLEDRLRLFTKTTDIKVTRGQINLIRGGVTYEYQLNAELISKLNGQVVTVRYEDFSTIYLFDKKDRSIGSVKQKVGIHGAIADQTENDVKRLQQNKGRLNGVKTRARRENEQLRNKVEAMHPNALEALNKITTPKDVLEEVNQNYELAQRAAELGVDLERVEVGNKPKALIPDSLMANERKSNKPFSVRETHKVGLINFEDETE
ncbi:MAG: transposase family protein [Cyclobacteriaceae bacterium]|nr:transposase family protein [Cyclobacteriaceae bacterium]